MTVPDPELWAGLAEVAADPAPVTIGARYHGTCQGCGERWQAGDPIIYDADEGAWLHADCAV